MPLKIFCRQIHAEMPISLQRWIAVVGVCIILAAPLVVLAADTLFSRGNNEFCLSTDENIDNAKWDLGLVKGEVSFCARGRASPADSAGIPDAMLSSCHFVRDGNTIRVRVDKEQVRT